MAETIDSCNQLNNLAPSQRLVLENAFVNGLSVDFGFTLAAIAFEESKAGLWNINFQDPSAGVFHTSLRSVLQRLNMKDTSFNRNLIGQRLIDDETFASKMAIKELRFWQKVHNGDWMKMYESYNAGYGKNPKYATRIRSNIRTLVSCKFDRYIDRLYYQE